MRPFELERPVGGFALVRAARSRGAGLQRDADVFGREVGADGEDGDARRAAAPARSRPAAMPSSSMRTGRELGRMSSRWKRSRGWPRTGSSSSYHASRPSKSSSTRPARSGSAGAERHAVTGLAGGAEAERLAGSWCARRTAPWDQGRSGRRGARSRAARAGAGVGGRRHQLAARGARAARRRPAGPAAAPTRGRASVLSRTTSPSERRADAACAIGSWRSRGSRHVEDARAHRPPPHGWRRARARTGASQTRSAGCGGGGGARSAGAGARRNVGEAAARVGGEAVGMVWRPWDRANGSCATVAIAARAIIRAEPGTRPGSGGR